MHATCERETGVTVRTLRGDGEGGIASRGVLSPPGLVIDGEVVLAGRVSTRE
jgi:hypothetical protein